MITKAQRRNAERIVAVADALGDLPYNNSGQTTNTVMNLSIPCAKLVLAGVVTGVDPETNDGLTDAAVDAVETHARWALARAIDQWGDGWWLDRANALGLSLVTPTIVESR